MKKIILPLVCFVILATGILVHQFNVPEPVGAIPTLPTQAHTVAGERVTVEQRGNSVRAQFPWKDEQGFTVSYDMGAATPQEIAKGKRNRQVITEQLNDTDFKIDIILDEKPNTNVFCYQIEGHERYSFNVQNKEDHEADGGFLPENLHRSIAVYHKTLSGGEYLTGKVLHIPRPEVWEVNNKEATRQWADLSYNNGQLCVTANQSFLDNATYPVRIDPTFGYTSIGAGSTELCLVASDRSYRIGNGRTLSEDGTLDSMSVALGTSNAATENVDLSLFLNTEDTVTDSHTQVAALETLNLQITPTAAFKTISASSESITADDYVISALCNGADTVTDNILLYRDVSGSQTFYSETVSGATSYADLKESPWTETESAGSAFNGSIYATYTATPAATVTNNLNISGDIEIGGDIIIE